MADFEVRLAAAEEVDLVAATLTAGYGREFSADWVRWKHHESPFGPSQCHLAEDGEGVLGVAFRMPWPSKFGTTAVNLVRLVDGTSTPRAVRRGVFRAVVRSMMDAGGPFDVALATATPEARGAHVKNGAITPESIGAVVHADLPQPASLARGPELLDDWTDTGGGLRSAWTGSALRWRVDRRSGLGYTVARLRHADDNHGVIYRVAGSGARRVVAVVSGWGPAVLQRRVVRAACWQARTPVTLWYEGPGTPNRPRRPARPSGESLMCVWGSGIEAYGAGRVDRWSYDGLELEGVV